MGHLSAVFLTCPQGLCLRGPRHRGPKRPAGPEFDVQLCHIYFTFSVPINFTIETDKSVLSAPHYLGGLENKHLQVTNDPHCPLKLASFH